MGKLLSTQKKIQDKVESTINFIEEGYLKNSQKVSDLTNKLYKQNKETAATAGAKLRELNDSLGEKVADLIAKIEKEPSGEEKAKEVVDKAASATKSVIEKAAEQAAKVSKKLEKVEEALTED